MVQTLQEGILSKNRRWKNMWVIFLLSSMAFAIVSLLTMYVGNKIINAMKRDDSKLEKELENNRSEVEKEKEMHE